MILQDERDRAGPIVDRVNAAIRDNPLAAGLIGAGLAWMLMGGTKGFGALAGAAAGAGKGLASAGAANAAAMGSAAASRLSNAASAAATLVKDTVSNAAGSVASLVPDVRAPDTDKAVADAKAAVVERFDAAADTTREYGAAIQSRLSQSLEKQPLLLGAIGLAIGAGIASTFATTSVESELMGTQGSAAREKLQSLAGEATDRAKQVVSDIKDEASRQGFTSEGAAKAAAGIREKLKVVASAGKEAVKPQETRY